MMSSLPDTVPLEPAARSADLQLQFSRAPDKQTFVRNQFGRYPFHVCRAQYMDVNPAGLATVYLQSSSGGIFEHDRLSGELHGLPGSQSHITTQASTIAHRMDNGCAHHKMTIRAEEDSYLEYLVNPMILFPQSDLRSTVHVQQHPDSTVILADGFMHHDPDGSEAVFRSYFSEIRVENLAGGLQCLDRYQVSGEDFVREEPGIMGKHRIQSTFLVLSRSISLNDLSYRLRTGMDESADGYAGVSRLPNQCGVMVRILSTSAHRMERCITRLWQIARCRIFGEYPALRRK